MKQYMGLYAHSQHHQNQIQELINYVANIIQGSSRKDYKEYAQELQIRMFALTDNDDLETESQINNRRKDIQRFIKEIGEFHKDIKLVDNEELKASLANDAKFLKDTMADVEYNFRETYGDPNSLIQKANRAYAERQVKQATFRNNTDDIFEL